MNSIRQTKSPAVHEGRTVPQQASDNKLFADALAIEALSAKDAGSISYMARFFVQATLPHSEKTGTEFSRVNGNLRVSLLAPANVGLPYGSYPRLLLLWLTSEAFRTKSRQLCLGHNLTEFMRKLGLCSTGGRWGTISRLHDQATRLFQSHVTICETNELDRDLRHRGCNIVVADAWDLWWDLKAPHGSPALFGAWVTLNETFFKTVTDRPVPLDLRAVRALKKSPLALDVYAWTSYRMSYLRRRTEIPWQSLQMQFGADYPRTAQGCRNFRKNFASALRKVTTVYPALRSEESKRGLVLLPSSPHVVRLR